MVKLNTNEAVEYLYEYFNSDYEKLEKFARMFDGFNFYIDVDAVKRFSAQQMLINGDRPCDIAKKLDMRRTTVQTMKHRMFSSGIMLYAKENEEKYEELVNGHKKRG